MLGPPKSAKVSSNALSRFAIRSAILAGSPGGASPAGPEFRKCAMSSFSLSMICGKDSFHSPRNPFWYVSKISPGADLMICMYLTSDLSAVSDLNDRSN